MKARQIAMGGVFAALAVVLMLLGGLIPIGTYAAPMLASLLLIPLLRELSPCLCVGWYVVVSLLSSLFCPDRETALVFCFLGWYPIFKPRLDRLRPVSRLLCKLLIFNAAVAALYAVLIFLFRLEAVMKEWKKTAPALLAGMLLLGNATFLVYDAVLCRLTAVYRARRGR